MTAVPALPDRIAACLFDLDGVLVRTASVHAAAWKRLFDDYLRGREEPFREFTPADYSAYVDGRLREDGVRAFLASRGIELPEAEVRALADRKNALLLETLEREGVETYDGSIRFARAARDAGLAAAVVSASRNTRAVLAATGIADLFPVVVDGIVAGDEGLAGKPRPDTFLAAAARLGVEPERGAVFEDALAGVEAGRAGGFGCVVGVDRGAGAGALRDRGADIVVADLAELLEER